MLIEINFIEIAESFVVPLAFLVGMFLKTAERTFYGISQRLFAMVEATIPDTKTSKNPNSHEVADSDSSS